MDGRLRVSETTNNIYRVHSKIFLTFCLTKTKRRGDGSFSSDIRTVIVLTHILNVYFDSIWIGSVIRSPITPLIRENTLTLPEVLLTVKNLVVFRKECTRSTVSSQYVEWVPTTAGSLWVLRLRRNTLTFRDVTSLKSYTSY